LSTVFREQPIISATRLASMRVFFVIKLIALVWRVVAAATHSLEVLLSRYLPLEPSPISLPVALPTSRVSFRLFIGGCLSVFAAYFSICRSARVVPR
jgi:hypothetical protein